MDLTEMRGRTEAVLLDVGEEIGRLANEKHLSGELSQKEFQTIYNSLHSWSKTTEVLLNFLERNSAGL